MDHVVPGEGCIRQARGALLGMSATECEPTAGCLSPGGAPMGGPGGARCPPDQVFVPQPAGYWTCNI